MLMRSPQGHISVNPRERERKALLESFGGEGNDQYELHCVYSGAMDQLHSCDINAMHTNKRRNP